MNRIAVVAATVAALAVSTACEPRLTQPGAGNMAELRITAVVVGTPIDVLVVEVTAADIQTPLVFNIQVVNGVAQGTIRIPPGTARTITVRAYDSAGDVTHEGSKTIDVKPGQNPPVSIPVVSKAGQVPITVIIGPVSVVVQPVAPTLIRGSTVPLSVTITAADGELLTGPAEWATTNPAVATVDQAGNVTGVMTGTADIVATFAGVAGVSHVSVVAATATSIPFAPEPGPFANILVLGDDVTTGPLPIGFDFVFFGTTYTQFNISSNGFVGFDAFMNSGCCNGQPIPSNDFVNNMIAVAWTDLYPPGGGTISWETRGTAPNRRLIVNYQDIHLFAESGTPPVTAQVILYEQSNLIEVHTTQLAQPLFHVYTQGVENADGTEAAFLPGRVAASFALQNDGVRFATASTPGP